MELDKMFQTRDRWFLTISRVTMRLPTTLEMSQTQITVEKLFEFDQQQKKLLRATNV
jgi:hypothetical protein